MSEYYLTCVCGRKMAVSAAQCGETIGCACGEQLEVPSLRELKALAPAAETTSTSKRREPATWDDRHRGAYLLGLAGVVCLLMAGYLGWRLSELRKADPTLRPAVIAKDVTQATPLELMSILRQSQHGLQPLPPAPFVPDNFLYRRLGWEIGIATALGAGLLIAAAGVVYLRPGNAKKLRST